jgi:predicted PurR-regulated permease PerM
MTDAPAPQTTPPAPGGQPADAGDRHPTLLFLLGLAAAVVVVAGLKSFSGTLGPAFFALVLVITFHPVQTWMLRHRVPRVISIISLLVVIYLLILGLAAALGLSIARLAILLPTYSAQFNRLVGQGTDLLEKVGVGQSQINSALSNFNVTSLLGVAQTVAGGLTSSLSDLLFILLLLFFLAADAAPFPGLLARAGRDRPQLVGALIEFASGTRRFLVVSTIFGGIVAVLDVITLWILGVPLALLWGLLALITNYIANIGFVIGVVPPALLALLASGPTTAVIVVIAYAVINFIVQSLIQPKFVGDAVGLSVTLTFLSLVFWGFALGSLGALFAVPLSLLVRAVLVDANTRAHWLLPLIAGNAADPHEAPPPADTEALAEQDPTDDGTREDTADEPQPPRTGGGATAAGAGDLGRRR